MKTKVTQTGIAEDGKPALYSDHTTPLPIGEWDVELVWQWRDSRGNWFILRDSFIRNGKPTNYTTDDFDTRQIYLSPLPPAQPVKAVEEEIKVQITFRHPNGSELVSAPYTIEQLLEKSEDEIQEATCDCDCKPTGESSYKDCNCADYYEKFVLVKSSLYSPHPIETPAIATSEGVEVNDTNVADLDIWEVKSLFDNTWHEVSGFALADAKKSGFEIRKKEASIADRALNFYPVKIAYKSNPPHDCNLKERKAFIAGASHILNTHVPVDDVEKIIMQYDANQLDFTEMLDKIKSLKSKTVL